MWDFERADAALVAGFRELATSTIGDALDRLGFAGVLSGIRPVAPGLRCAGPAVTVRELTGPKGSFPGSDFRIGAVIDGASAGDVVVIDNGGNAVSTWGGMASYAAKLRDIAGLVVDGGVRDAEEIAEVGFAVFSRHLVPTAGRTRIKVEAINTEITPGGVRVRPGDIVVADGTGVICVPADLAVEALALAQGFAAEDARAMNELRDGLSFTEALGKFKSL